MAINSNNHWEKRNPRRMRPSGRACRKAIRSALTEGWTNGQEQPRQNRHQHGLASWLMPYFQSSLAIKPCDIKIGDATIKGNVKQSLLMLGSWKTYQADAN